jgi:two-component system chemotaxis response regulator CheY
MQLNVGTAMKLPAALDLGAAPGFLNAVREAARNGSPLQFDASAVETLTLPCAQIIMSALKHGEAKSIFTPSEAFAQAFDDLGLEWLQYVNNTPAAAAAAEPAQSPPQTDGQPAAAQISENAMSKRILTIDDSKTMRDMLMLTLAEAGFDVLQAVDGQDGLDVLGKEQVDVVITDINMPRMDGYEVIRQLRNKPEHQKTPILVLTTESEAEKKNIGRDAGATGWLVKPFDPDRLVETVRKVAS